MATWIGISLGDVTGIGPEVTLKALGQGLSRRLFPPEIRFLILGDPAWLARANAVVNVPLARFVRESPAGTVCVLDPRPEPLPATLAPGAAPAARAALDWLRAGAERCLRGELAALVTAPVNKEAIARSGTPFTGATEFLAGLAGVPDPVMMLLGADDRGRWLRVALATTHLPLRQVAEAVTPAKVSLAIARAAAACRQLGLPTARVGVCGLNPHAGEGGLLGREEIEVVQPAVEAARARGWDATGPLAADTIFHQALHGRFDAVVAMYHDQGLAPLKLAAFDTGVNWTLGLPFIRTSPDHGTAYELAGQDRANPSSMLAAIQLAVQLALAQRA